MQLTTHRILLEEILELCFILFEPCERPCISESGKSLTGRAPKKPSISAGPICGEVDNINLLDATVTMGEPKEQGNTDR